MTIQVLCATRNQYSSLSLCKKMNIQSDVIFANQCEKVFYEETRYNGHKVKMIATNTLGVGINRNIALMYADADICLLADDDLKYVDDYISIIKEAFEKLPDADAIIFNIGTIGRNVDRRINSKIKRVRLFNCLNYGTPRIAFRTKSIMRENIMFSRCFGGGTEFSAGEDSLFIIDMLKKKMKVYTYPVKIAEVDQTDSTWFTGYHEKFFYDKGAWIACAFPRLKFLMCCYFIIRFAKLSSLTFDEQCRYIKHGLKGYHNLISYERDLSNEK